MPHRWRKLVIFSLSLQGPLNEHIKWAKPQTNFSGFSFSLKKAFPSEHWWNSETKVHTERREGKINWGGWTNQCAPHGGKLHNNFLEATNRSTTSLYRHTDTYINAHTHHYLEDKYCLQTSSTILPLPDCKPWPETGRFLLLATLSALSKWEGHSAWSLQSFSLHHSFLLWGCSTFRCLRVK